MEHHWAERFPNATFKRSIKFIHLQIINIIQLIRNRFVCIHMDLMCAWRVDGRHDQKDAFIDKFIFPWINHLVSPKCCSARREKQLLAGQNKGSETNICGRRDKRNVVYPPPVLCLILECDPTSRLMATAHREGRISGRPDRGERRKQVKAKLEVVARRCILARKSRSAL